MLLSEGKSAVPAQKGMGDAMPQSSTGRDAICTVESERPVVRLSAEIADIQFVVVTRIDLEAHPSTAIVAKPASVLDAERRPTDPAVARGFRVIHDLPHHCCGPAVEGAIPRAVEPLGHHLTR